MSELQRVVEELFGLEAIFRTNDPNPYARVLRDKVRDLRLASEDSYSEGWDDAKAESGEEIGQSTRSA